VAMVQRKITVAEARKIFKNDNLTDQEVESILIKLYGLCERVVDKTMYEKNTS
jgi:hypothetical protein